ncbi:MAG: hypothetical protein AAB152_18635 [Candidatus Coatesbacteria bacterium]
MITNIASMTMSSGFPSYVAYTITYSMSIQVRVLCPPVVRGLKTVWPATGGAGETLTYSICVVNERTESIWDITVTDALPGNMTFAAMSPANYDMTNGGPFVLGAVVESNASATAGPWNAGGPTVGQAPAYYLRWVIPGVGPAKSACVTFSARIL